MKLALPNIFAPGAPAAPDPSADKRSQIALYVGYVVFFVFCFLFFAYLTFPYERLRDIITDRFAILPPDGKTAPKMVMKIEELSPHWLTGVALQGVTIERTAEGATEPTVIQIDEVTLSAAPIAYLLDRIEVSFALESGDGSLEGKYITNKEGKGYHVIAEADALDLGKLGVGSFIDVPLAGKLTGTIDVDLPEEASAATGLIDVKIDELAIGDGKNKVKLPMMTAGMTIDKIDAGTLTMKVPIKEGVASIETFEAKGKDLEADGSGSVRLGSPFERSRADVTFGLKFDDGYKNRSERTKIVFEMMTNNPIAKRALDPDGTLRLQGSGAITSLRFRAAAPTAAAKPGAAKPKRAAKKKAAGEEEPSAEEEAP
jgi:type II secretion system protein N